MKRAVRKRAGKLREKALKSVAKSKGSDLQSVSNRLSQMQYADVLARFENPTHDSLEQLARDLASSVMLATEQTAEQEATKFITDQHLSKIECAAGCSWCCRQPLQVSILGAVSVAAYILDNDLGETYLPRLADYIRTLEPFEYDHKKLKDCFRPCPFLGEDHRCQVYQARPVVCRAFHSTDKACCERIIRDQTEERDVPMFPRLFGFIGVRLSGARQALSALGLDDRPVVLGAAVKLLLDDFQGTVADWISGGHVFDDVVIRQ
jgi:Fe-S-cluster containining protein